MTHRQQLECAERELKMRERVYPRWVAQEKMNQEKADHEIACMRAIVATLKPLAEQESGQMSLL
jgi:hypothetical protein